MLMERASGSWDVRLSSGDLGRLLWLRTLDYSLAQVRWWIRKASWISCVSAVSSCDTRFPGAGTKARRTGSSARPRSGASRADLWEVRARARSNGHQVSDRGRVSAAIQQAYDAAH